MINSILWWGGLGVQWRPWILDIGDIVAGRMTFRLGQVSTCSRVFSTLAPGPATLPTKINEKFYTALIK